MAVRKQCGNYRLGAVSDTYRVDEAWNWGNAAAGEQGRSPSGSEVENEVRPVQSDATY